MPPATERVLSFPDALAEVLQHAETLKPHRAAQTVSLAASAGRILAEPLRAARDQPPFHRSTRDGFALRTADLSGTAPLRIAGSLRAGQNYTGGLLLPGQAMEIMTGAPVPEGADAVLMVEHAVVDGSGEESQLRPSPGRILLPGENIVPRAAEARAGAELLPAGRRLAAPEIALAASCGQAALAVYAQPTVAIVATGDELVELDATPEPWEIYNSNSYALGALVSEAGGTPLRLATARDTRADIAARLEQARSADLLLLSGGVSMGKYDLVEEVLSGYGAEFLFTGTLIQPGKPLVFGRLPKGGKEGAGKRERDGSVPEWQYFFGLPGNPVSTEACFRLFAAPLLRALAGETGLPPRFVEARLAEDVRGGARVTRFLPAVLRSDWQSATVKLVPWQGSGDLAANARANCFAVLPAEAPSFAAGETIRVLLR